METTFSDASLEARAGELIHLIKTRFIRSDGLLARSYPVTERTIFDNFDDVVPFFLYFGEADFLLNQVRIITRQGLGLAALCAEDGVLMTSTIDEWFGGLHALWLSTRDRDTFKLLTESMSLIEERLVQKEFLPAALDLKSGPVDFYEPWSAGLLETFCEMREEFPKAFDNAQLILRSWLSDEYFQKYGLFPYRVFRATWKNYVHKTALSRIVPRHRHTKAVANRLRPPLELLRFALMSARFETTTGWYSQLMKSNSTCAFAMLEFHRATGDSFWLDSLERWVQSALAHFCDVGQVYAEYFPVLDSRRDAGVAPAFILVDVICDAAQADARFRPYLDRARMILDHYWSHRLGNGLIPEIDGGQRAHIDHQIDFSVSLRRYAEAATNSQVDRGEYAVKAIDLTRTALLRHHSASGYLTYSGSVKRNLVDPKYNALVLKGVINLLTAGEPLYPKHHDLFKDR